MHSLSQDTRASGHQIYFVIKGFAPFKPKADICTARKRSLGQGNVFTRMCHSVHGGRGSLYDVTSCLAAWSHVLSGGSVSGPMYFLGVSVSGPIFLPEGVSGPMFLLGVSVHILSP